MNSIEIMKMEIERQSYGLKVNRSSKNGDSDNYLFVGSGDSYISGLLASYESNFNYLCMDPAEIIINPNLCQDKRVCFISISGKTKENILAAKKAKKYLTKLPFQEKDFRQPITNSFVLICSHCRQNPSYTI